MRFLPSLSAASATSILTLLCALSARPAHAQDVGGATVLFDEGKKLADAGDYAAACPKFEASLNLDPLLGTRMNLADCFARTSKFGSAKRTWQEALTQAKEQKDERVGFIEGELAKAAAKASALRLDVTQGAETLSIRVAGEAVSSVKWSAPIDLDAGKVEVEVVRDGEVLETKSVDLSEGETETLALDLAAISKAHPAKKDAAPVEPVDPAQRIAGITIFSVGLAGVAAFGVLEVVGLSLRSSANDPEKCNPTEGPSLCSPEGYEEAELAGDLAEVGQWIGVGAVAVAAVGLTVFLTAPSEADAADDAKATASISPWFSPAGGGLSVKGTFR